MASQVVVVREFRLLDGRITSNHFLKRTFDARLFLFLLNREVHMDLRWIQHKVRLTLHRGVLLGEEVLLSMVRRAGSFFSSLIQQLLESL